MSIFDRTQSRWRMDRQSQAGNPRLQSGSAIVGVAIGIALGIEEERMTFGHEQLDVYRAAIEYVGWSHRLCERLKAHRNAREQLLRASQSIPLNIAEGNGKATEGERRRYFEIARGSALECGAIQDVLEVCGALPPLENTEAKKLLDRIAAMLTKLGRRGYGIREAADRYSNEVDSETASDTDADAGEG
jgi:four helix bundle protein